MFSLTTREKVIMINLDMQLFKEVVDKVVLVTLIFRHHFQIFLKMYLVALMNLVLAHPEDQEEGPAAEVTI